MSRPFPFLPGPSLPGRGVVPSNDAASFVDCYTAERIQREQRNEVTRWLIIFGVVLFFSVLAISLVASAEVGL